MKKRDNKHKGFEEVLGLEPAPEIELEEVHVESRGTHEDIKQDYELVREKIIFALERTSTVIDDAVKNIKTDPSARNVEAAAAALKVLTDNAKSLIEIHDAVRELAPQTEEGKESDVKKVKGNLADIIKIVERTANAK